MKILTYSDLHFELNKGKSFRLPDDIDGDIMILDGDILNFDDPRELDNLLRFLEPWGDKPVLYVAGNHEYYTDTEHDIKHLQDRFCKFISKIPQIAFLNNSVYTISPWSEMSYAQRRECSRLDFKSVSFFGGTMWTDLEDGTKALVAHRNMNDYRFIKHDGRLLTPKDTMQFHEEFLKALKRWIDNCDKSTIDKRVVISHHCPIQENGKYEEQCAYVSTKTRAIIEDPNSKIDLWVYGHTHQRHDYIIGNTRIVSNPYGYHWHDDKDRFDKYGAVVEI